MLRKVLSLSVVSAILVSTVACGGSTTSLYRGTEDLGDQISNNISKIIDDAEKSMENIPNDNQRYDTYDTKNRIYTTGNGYMNNYSSLNKDYNYNGVSTKYEDSIGNTDMSSNNNLTNKTSSKLQNNLTNTVPKTNTITSMSVDNEDNQTVPKTNTIATFPQNNDNDDLAFDDSDTNYLDDFTGSIAKIIDEYTDNGDNLDIVNENSNSISRILNSTNSTLSSVKNDITNPNPNTIGTKILPNSSNVGMGSVPNGATNTSYAVGTTTANNGVNTSGTSDATPMIIA